MPKGLLSALSSISLGPIPAAPRLMSVPSPPTARQPCTDNGEQLVTLEGVVPVHDAYDTLNILLPRPHKVRASVASKLEKAHHSLPAPFGLVVLDGWRTIAEQQQLVNFYRTESQFVASIDPDRMRPPHTTGGAVDLTLTINDGIALALGTDYDEFSPFARLDSLESSDAPIVARDLRRLLAVTLLKVGFVPYAPEWWHWSYGDDVWANYNHCAALYDIHSE